ncbi:hypothetical protein DTO164E3_7983 [Paecilomyces variotii]|nr:hypothetical protein DTO164E3_7983 [Paecilomyces variotii]KAJ9405197.1 hypothetical protein DTO045G8_7086 [Paecilomyces variotii]
MASQCYCAKPLRSCHRESARSALDIVLGRRLSARTVQRGWLSQFAFEGQKDPASILLLLFSIKLTNYCNTDEKAQTSQIVKTRNRECEDSPLAP